jgi:hypothetical protein
MSLLPLPLVVVVVVGARLLAPALLRLEASDSPSSQFLHFLCLLPHLCLNLPSNFLLLCSLHFAVDTVHFSFPSSPSFSAPHCHPFVSAFTSLSLAQFRCCPFISIRPTRHHYRLLPCRLFVPAPQGILVCINLPASL